MGQQGYRAPWGEDHEMRQFRSEIESAMSEGADRFRLYRDQTRTAVDAPAPERGMFSRLFHRT